MATSHEYDVTNACVHIDDLFHLDELMRLNYNISFGSAYGCRRTGSSIEGAVICKLLKPIPEMEEDTMQELLMLPEDDVTNILEGVINKIGYYKIRLRELISAVSCFDTIGYNKEYFDFTDFKHFLDGKILYWAEGAPNVSVTININSQLLHHQDFVP